MAEPSTEDLARQIHSLQAKIDGSTRPTRLDNSSVVGASGVETDIAAAYETAVEAADALPGITDLLSAAADAVAATSADVDAAIAAAQEASDAGVAAGELAQAAADEALANAADAAAAADNALDKAQEALDAAVAAGGGATYSGSAPTSGTPGKNGQQWFVWDSNYKITAYYVYNAATSSWVLTEITDAAVGNLDAGSITSGYLGAERIAAASLTAAVLAADTITSREIAADAVLARNIKAGEITGAKIAAETILAANIKSATITSAQIAAATITGGNIAANTITAGNIKAGTITANEIAAGAITADKLTADAINGKTITGATIKTAVSGQRLEIIGQRLDVYGPRATAAARIEGFDADATAGLSGIRMGLPNSSGVIEGGLLVITQQNLGAYPFVNAPAASFRAQASGGFRVLGDAVFDVVSMAHRPPDGGPASNAIPAITIARNGSDQGFEVVVKADKFLDRNGNSISDDTGWVTVTGIPSEYTANGAQVRVVRGVMYGRGTINKQSGVIPNGSLALCSIPTSIPAVPATTNFSPIWQQTPSAFSNGWVSTGRTINVNVQNTNVSGFALSSVNGVRVD